MKENFESQAALLDPGKTKTIGNYVIGYRCLMQERLSERAPLEKLKRPRMFLQGKRSQLKYSKNRR